MPDDEGLREELAAALRRWWLDDARIEDVPDHPEGEGVAEAHIAALLPVVERHAARRAAEARQDLAAYLIRVYEHARADAVDGQ